MGSQRVFRLVWAIGRRGVPAFGYLLVSVLGALIDLIVGLSLVAQGFSSTLAATLGYAIGLVAIYPILRSRIFKSRFSAISTELSLYLISGLVGILINGFAVFICDSFLEIGYLPSKISALAASFFLVFWFRYFAVFSRFRSSTVRA